MKSYAVIGLGRFGYKIATSLYEMGEDVLAIDQNEEIVNSIANKVTQAVVADAKNRNVLKKLGVADCDCVIIAIASNLEASVLITMNVKSFGVSNLICKAHDETHEEILLKLGANKVIIPEYEEAEKTARSLSSPNFHELIDISEEFSIIEMLPPKTWIGKSLKELDIRKKYNVNIIAAKKDNEMKVSLSADYIIEKDVYLFTLGDNKSLDKINMLK